MISRVLAISLLGNLVAACGARQPPHDPPSPTGGSASGAGRPTGETSAAPAPATSGLTPELIEAARSQPLVINKFSSLRLTAAERRIAQERIAAWATAAGLTILPPATVEDAIDRAAAGLDPTTGKACGPPIDRAYAMERWILPMGARGSINAHVECAAECTLQLEIRVPGHGAELYAAPFDTGKPWQAELERRLQQVIPNGHGHHDHNPAAAAGVTRKDGASDWFFDENSYQNRIAHADAVRCGMANRDVALLLERAPGGALRCEPAVIAHMVTEYDPKVNACMCAMALQKEHPTAPRSYLIYPSPLPPTDQMTRNGKLISTSLVGGGELRPDGTAPWFLRGDDSITDCFVARTDDVTKYEATATLAFDANGAAATATIDDPQGQLRPDERACITKKLMTIMTPCPGPQPEPGVVRIMLWIDKRNG